MYHSITFYSTGYSYLTPKNTYKDWKLIPTSLPVVAPPTPKTNYISGEGADGAYDGSDSVMGLIRYENRTGKWQFMLEIGQDWLKTYSAIMDYLHGEYVKVTFEDDPNYYWQGRVTIDDWASSKSGAIITLSYNLEPFKYDPSTQKTKEKYVVTTASPVTVTFTSTRMPVSPGITAEIASGKSMSATYSYPVRSSTSASGWATSNKTTSLVNGVNVLPEFVVTESTLNHISEVNKITFRGDGTVYITYIGGWL